VGSSVSSKSTELSVDTTNGRGLKGLTVLGGNAGRFVV
jgi:hypothetical protein